MQNKDRKDDNQKVLVAVIIIIVQFSLLITSFAVISKGRQCMRTKPELLEV